MKGPQIMSRNTVRAQLGVLQVESLSLRHQEDLQAMKLNYIKYTAYSKCCNMNIVNTCESPIWNPPAISLETHLHLFFPQKNELEDKKINNAYLHIYKRTFLV